MTAKRIIAAIVVIVLGLPVVIIFWAGVWPNRYPVLAPDERIPDIAEGWYRSPGPQPVFRFEGPFPRIPDEVLLYEVIAPVDRISEQGIRELASDCFDIPTDAALLASNRWPKLQTDKWLFEYEYSTGFFNILKYPRGDGPRSKDPNDFPTTDEALKIATDYLRERNLLPADAGEGRASDLNIRGTGVMNVGWSRRIGDYRVIGTGGEVSVRIGPGGEVVYVSKRWPGYRPWKTAPIVTPQEAMESLNAGGRALLSSDGGTVERIELIYDYLPGKRYMQPVYYFWLPEINGYRPYAAVPAVRPEYIDHTASPADPPRRHPTDPAHTP